MNSFKLHLIRFLVVTSFALSAGCAVTTIDVDVYKGPLANNDIVQSNQLYATMVESLGVVSTIRLELDHNGLSSSDVYTEICSIEKQANDVVQSINSSNPTTRPAQDQIDQDLLIQIAGVGERMALFSRSERMREIGNKYKDNRLSTTNPSSLNRDAEYLLEHDLKGSTCVMATLGNILTATADELRQRSRFDQDDIGNGARDKQAIKSAFATDPETIAALEAIWKQADTRPRSTTQLIGTLRALGTEQAREAANALSSNTKLSSLTADDPDTYFQNLQNEIYEQEKSPEVKDAKLLWNDASRVKEAGKKLMTDDKSTMQFDVLQKSLIAALPNSAPKVLSSNSFKDYYDDTKKDITLEQLNAHTDALSEWYKKDLTQKGILPDQLQLINSYARKINQGNRRTVIDDVIAILQFRLLHLKSSTAVVITPKGTIPKTTPKPSTTPSNETTAKAAETQTSEEDQRAELAEAIKYAYELRKSMIYLRPPSAYLRASSTPDRRPHPAGLYWKNELLEQSLRTVPFYGTARQGFSTDLKTAEYVDQFYWQNINHIRVSGSGNTNQVMVKDDIGNWYVKGFDTDSSKVAAAMLNLALASSTKTDLGGSLFKKVKPLPTTAPNAVSQAAQEEAERKAATEQAQAKVDLSRIQTAVEKYDKAVENDKNEVIKAFKKETFATATFASTEEFDTFAEKKKITEPILLSTGDSAQDTVVFLRQAKLYCQLIKDADTANTDRQKRVENYYSALAEKITTARQSHADELDEALKSINAEVPNPTK